ncbi:MAG: hypothetical protein AAFW59_01050 [Pseudomonadota bacterium]
MIILITRLASIAFHAYRKDMESASLQILREREQELNKEISALRMRLRRLQDEAEQVRRGVQAMSGQIISPSGNLGSKQSILHHRRKANPDLQELTFKQLTLKALSEHFEDGATANELLDFFRTRWGRTDIVRTSLSPQLTRLKRDGKISLNGKTWRLASKENGEA